MIDGDKGSFALCDWCWDYVIEHDQLPNAPAHWWAAWRWQRNVLGRIVPWCCHRVGAEVHDRIIDFILGPAPEP